MARHRGVQKMINSALEDYQENSDSEEKEDLYDEKNFDLNELKLIKQLEITYYLINRKQIIDVLYQTDADEYEFTKKLSALQEAKLKSNNSQQQQKSKKETKQVEKTNQFQQQSSQVDSNQKKDNQQPSQHQQQQQQEQLQQKSDVKKGGLDQIYPDIFKNKQENNCVNIIIFGHVDSGKSTLVGRLLQASNSLTDREIMKFQKQAKDINKESFAYAWACDETQEERKRGITMDLGYKQLFLNNKTFNLIDSPGHKDYIVQMIQGSAQADYGILVIDCKDFESGKKGQTAEHISIIKALDIQNLIIAINKMDLIQWNEERYKLLVEKVNNQLGSSKFKSVVFIPISAYQNQNISHKYEEYTGQHSLLQLIENLKPQEQLVNKPTRMTVLSSCVQQENKVKGNTIFGIIYAGMISKGQTYYVQPLDVYIQVKDISVNDIKANEAFAGQFCEMSINIENQNLFLEITQGMIISSKEYPIPCITQCQAELLTFEMEYPLIKGMMLECFINGQRSRCSIKKFIKSQNKRTIESNTLNLVTLIFQDKVCLELKENYKQYSNILLRFKNNIIGVASPLSISNQ